MKWTSSKRSSSRSSTTSWRRSSRPKGILKDGYDNKSRVLSFVGPRARRSERMHSAGWCQTIKQVRVCLCVSRACLQLAEAQTDSEDVQRSVQQLKKKCQKLTAELQDTKLHLEGLQSRNHDLEKKQRKSVSLRLLSVPCLFLTRSFQTTYCSHVSLGGAGRGGRKHSDPLSRTLMFSFHLNSD